MLLALQSTSQALDEIGSTRGSVLYRASTAWSALVPGTSGQVLTSGGAGADPSWQSVPGVGWTGITAGSGASTTANGDSAIVYQVAQTSADRISWRFTESAAGVSTGTPVLVQLDTVAASTALPLLVKARGSEVMRIPAAGGQILIVDGSLSLPALSFALDPDTGIYRGAPNTLSFVTGSANVMQLRQTDLSVSDTGNFIVAVGVSNVLSQEVSLVPTLHLQKSTANSNGVEVRARKSRGTVTVPTSITSGDGLVRISGFAYLGSTNIYQEATRIAFDSTGTISDSTTGIGGIIRFSTRLQGTDTAVQERWRIEQAGWLVGQELATDPGTTILAAGTDFAMYRKNDKLVFAHNVGGTINYLTIPLDGSTTTWTQGTTAP